MGRLPPLERVRILPTVSIVRQAQGGGAIGEKLLATAGERVPGKEEAVLISDQVSHNEREGYTVFPGFLNTAEVEASLREDPPVAGRRQPTG